MPAANEGTRVRRQDPVSICDRRHAATVRPVHSIANAPALAPALHRRTAPAGRFSQKADMATDSRVGTLIDGGRRIRARCLVCERITDVDLAPILAAKGPEFTLAKRRPPCRDRTCPGRVVFEDYSSIWTQKFDEDIPLEDQFAHDAAERKRIEAAGWRMEMGHWIDPQGRPPWKRKTPPA